MRVNLEQVEWLIVILILVVCVTVLLTRPTVTRYRCIITVDDEVLCFEPGDGRMFRPERRFNRFILEVRK